MSILKRLFGAGTPKPAEAPVSEVYKDYTIFPSPTKDGQVYRIAATIKKDMNGETLSHHLIRADTLGSHIEAEAASIAKAKLMIDQMGDRMFR